MLQNPIGDGLDSGHCLVPLGNKVLPELILIKFDYAMRQHGQIIFDEMSPG